MFTYTPVQIAVSDYFHCQSYSYSSAENTSLGLMQFHEQQCKDLCLKNGQASRPTLLGEKKLVCVRMCVCVCVECCLLYVCECVFPYLVIYNTLVLLECHLVQGIFDVLVVHFVQ